MTAVCLPEVWNCQTAAMLGRWLDIEGLEKVSVMGMSLGSVVAAYFAEQRPELVERMILMGVMQKPGKAGA